MAKESKTLSDDTLRYSAAELDTQRQTPPLHSAGAAHVVRDAGPQPTIRTRVDPASQSLLGQGGGSEVRYDVLSGRQTIFAAERGTRPVEFVREIKSVGDISACPFCHGNESLTPATLLAVDNDNDEARRPWLVRVVNNKYPAVSLLDPHRHQNPHRHQDGSLNGHPAQDHHQRSSDKRRYVQSRRTPNLFPAGPMAGGHEVIIESPDHTTSVSELNVCHLTKVYEAIAARIRVWREVPNVEYVSVFKNVGARAGASLSHAHSQLIATAILPPRVGDLIYRTGKHYDQTGCCLHCDLMRAEREAQSRIVFASRYLTAYCPYGSSLPYLTRIVPNQHAPRFEDSSVELLADLAQMTRRLVQCFERLFPGVDYNHVLHTRPPGAKNEDIFHWSMEWMPRITTQAGFEHASDCYINPTFPETAAAQLRGAAAELNPLRVPQTRSEYSFSER